MHATYPDGSLFGGPHHEVGRDELFFSTTDAEGVITQANQIFADMVRLPRERLIGVPHNVNRHPGMPGGAFLLMWTMLKAGKPFCAYVHNAASDGSRYTVFATITPLGDGYLSVRTPVCVDALLAAATGLYEAARPQELAARELGVSAHDAAVVGLEALVPLLQGAGFPTYDEFIWVALPAEVAARDALGATFPRREWARGQLAGLLDASARVHAELQGWFHRLGDLQRTADALVAARARLEETIASWKATASEFGGASDGQFRPLLLSINVWREMTTELERMLVEALAEESALREGCAETRFRIALARLHNDAVGQFVCELIDDLPGAAAARPAIRDLARALSEGVAATEERIARNSALATRVAASAREMAELALFPIPLLDSWRAMAEASGDPVALALLPGVFEIVSRGQADADLLTRLATDAARVAAPVDATAMHSGLADLTALVLADGTGVSDVPAGGGATPGARSPGAYGGFGGARAVRRAW